MHVYHAGSCAVWPLMLVARDRIIAGVREFPKKEFFLSAVPKIEGTLNYPEKAARRAQVDMPAEIDSIWRSECIRKFVFTIRSRDCRPKLKLKMSILRNAQRRNGWNKICPGIFPD